MPACVYILDTGRRRPCPAGEGCTEYERAPRGREAYREGLRREYTAFRAERGGGE